MGEVKEQTKRHLLDVVVYSALGMLASCAWIGLAHALGVDGFTRGWWAGALSTTGTMAALGRVRQMIGSRQ